MFARMPIFLRLLLVKTVAEDIALKSFSLSVSLGGMFSKGKMDDWGRGRLHSSGRFGKTEECQETF